MNIMHLVGDFGHLMHLVGDYGHLVIFLNAVSGEAWSSVARKAIWLGPESL